MAGARTRDQIRRTVGDLSGTGAGAAVGIVAERQVTDASEGGRTIAVTIAATCGRAVRGSNIVATGVAQQAAAVSSGVCDGWAAGRPESGAGLS